MTGTFEVGQTVKAFGDAAGEIVYGPVNSTHGSYTGYVVKIGDSDVWHRASNLLAVPEPPAFAVGDKVVTAAGIRGVVDAGPFKSRHASGGVFWVVADEDGTHVMPFEASLTKVVEAIKVGDRVRVTDDDGGGRNRFNGRVGTVKELHGEDASLPYLVEFGDGRGRHGDENGQWNCAAVERIGDSDTHVYDGVTYDLTATYRDQDGDTWRFARFGDVVTAAAYGDEPEAGSQRADDVIRRWAPFARV